ncbi:conserved phage C-terminal domain-containing protein [Staphylococcus caprae]|uniref:conserved phage C-terminal domain-containing protein n=1 Tax=Staphylococcus caprae TaxID=29380 RepID=UPI002551C6FE|nr:conserved phage C-terminal domain-containing protein [Staphylococcus caprae]MDK6296534.1 conserved phage C-terminal domain-containing protein [Staphylococcus caprae]MDK7233474.1 conserved phage C-terminal domain-containing protein [Staphylococcus caprae]
MNNRDYISSIITQFSGQNNIIPIPVIYIEITEDYHTAALLNQLIYWSDRTSRKDGYFYKSYKEWEEEIHLSKYQVMRATKKLKNMGIVETALKKANGAPTVHYKVDSKEVSQWIVKKLNNGKLRNSTMDSEETQQSLTEITTETTTKDILSGNPTAYPYKEVINYLNQQTGKQFRSTTKKNQSLIKARVNEGFTLDDFKKVINNMTSQWLNDNKMSKYLRPETLFGTKFEGYLNQELQPSGVDQLERMKYDPSYWD